MRVCGGKCCQNHLRSIMTTAATYDPSLYWCIKGQTRCYHQHNGRYYSHCYKSKLPLYSQSHNICREEKRDALEKGVQLFGNTLIDTIAI